VSDDCVLPTLEHWSSVAHKVLLATGLVTHLLRCGAPRLWNSLTFDTRHFIVASFYVLTTHVTVCICHAELNRYFFYLLTYLTCPILRDHFVWAIGPHSAQCDLFKRCLKTLLLIHLR